MALEPSLCPSTHLFRSPTCEWMSLNSRGRMVARTELLPQRHSPCLWTSPCVPGALENSGITCTWYLGLAPALPCSGSLSWKRGMTELVRFTPNPMKYYLFLHQISILSHYVGYTANETRPSGRCLLVMSSFNLLIKNTTHIDQSHLAVVKAALC